MKGNKTISPPRLAIRFLECFCPDALYESIEGDLLQEFEKDLAESGKRRARWKFWLNVAGFFHPYILLKNKRTGTLIGTGMIRSYLTVATRNIMKRKLYSFINAFGLSVGIAFCVLIYLYIRDERGFDQMHDNKDRIFRIEERSYDTWQKDRTDPYRRTAWLPVPLRQAIEDEIPEVEYSTRYNPESPCVFRYEDKVFIESLTFVDADFFRLFSFRLIQGNAERIFKNKLEVVLTPEIAKKYFGENDPIGKTIVIDNNGEIVCTVTGIIEPHPANSSLIYSVLIPQENRRRYEQNMTQWGNFSTPTFVQLVPGTDLEKFKRNLDKVVQKYMGAKLEQWKKQSTVAIPEDATFFELLFTNIKDIHLKKEVSWNNVSDPKYSYILGGLAVVILVIACINYISLALTTSTARKTEVGVRKVVGAHQRQLIYQFSFESVLLAVISMVAGIGIVVLMLPIFNEFTTKGIQLTTLTFFQLLGVSFVITLMVGMLAGSYPALFLARFRPALVLKGGFTSRLQSGFTKPLVVLQFGLSAALIICSVIMYRQMQFITTQNLGYDQNQIIVIPTHAGWNTDSDKAVERFRNRSALEPEVLGVTGTSTSFNQGYSHWGYKINGEQKAAYVYAVDPHYIETLGIELASGRNFDERIASDSSVIIVNEALVRDMKWTDPLNEHLNYQEDSTSLGSKVIGVMKDYHFLSLEKEIEPLFISINRKDVGHLSTILVKIKAGDIPASMDKLQGVWKELFPDKPFDYTFLDEDVARQYSSYKRWMKITGLSTGLAILISCLGLFGLAGINAVNRTKEIGIRKVMGAAMGNIFLLLNRQYIWLSLIAFSLAAPLSWYIMEKWLSGFVFRIQMGWELFAISMGSGLVIALATVSYHAIKAALINPAETLKYE